MLSIKFKRSITGGSIFCVFGTVLIKFSACVIPELSKLKKMVCTDSNACFRRILKILLKNTRPRNRCPL